MQRILIKNGQVVDPANERDGIYDVLLEQGQVAAISENISVDGAEIIDAEGCIVAPGFVDLHCHLREPGQEYKEDVASGTRAAIRGGFTSLVAMPNTEPAIDSEAAVRSMAEIISEKAAARVYPAGAITRGQKGRDLTEMGGMMQAGAVAFTDDGLPVTSSRVMQLALQYSDMLGVPISVHEEDPDLAGDGVVNRGRISTLLGLPAIPTAAESAMVARDLELCREFGGHLHIAHVSTRNSIDLIRKAKDEGLKVTCEVTPHHLTLTEDLVRESNYDTNTKVNPPLRTSTDVEALVNALSEGIVDVIATDHAPHSFDDKDKEYIFADFGISGLETAFSLLHDQLVLKGDITMNRLIAALTVVPATIFDLPGGTLSQGEPADLVILRPQDEWAVNPDDFVSGGKNTPLAGWSLTGRVDTVLVAGRIMMRDGELQC